MTRTDEIRLKVLAAAETYKDYPLLSQTLHEAVNEIERLQEELGQRPAQQTLIPPGPASAPTIM